MHAFRPAFGLFDLFHDLEQMTQTLLIFVN